MTNRLRELRALARLAGMAALMLTCGLSQSTVAEQPDAKRTGEHVSSPVASLTRPTVTRPTEGGHFRVTLRNLGPHPAPINKIHTWSVQVATPDGRPAKEAEIDFEGGMPDHGHGFPTRPRVTADRDPATHLIEGVKFNMTGLWRFEFRIRSGEVTDRVRFDMILD